MSIDRNKESVVAYTVVRILGHTLGHHVIIIDVHDSCSEGRRSRLTIDSYRRETIILKNNGLKNLFVQIVL